MEKQCVNPKQHGLFSLPAREKRRHTEPSADFAVPLPLGRRRTSAVPGGGRTLESVRETSAKCGDKQCRHRLLGRHVTNKASGFRPPSFLYLCHKRLPRSIHIFRNRICVTGYMIFYQMGKNPFLPSVLEHLEPTNWWLLLVLQRHPRVRHFMGF